MARGTVVGEPVVSQANTPEYEAGYAQAFGDRKAERGRWVWDAEQGRLVSAEEYRPPARALDAPIMCDRYMEGAHTPDGVDIGSRAKRRAYMRENGLADHSDFRQSFAELPKRREQEAREAHRQRKEDVARTIHKLESRRR